MYDYCFLRKNDTKSGVTAEYPLTSHEVLYTILNVRVISSCFAIKMLSKIKKGFSCLKCQHKRKKNWNSMFVKIFQVSSDEGMGK